MRANTAVALPRVCWRSEGLVGTGERITAEETPVAIVHDGSATAVMMATPGDLADFAIGFSLSEGVIRTPSEIRGLEVVENDLGLEVRLWLAADPSRRLAARRRRLAGPTGCGLCGLDSLSEAVRPPTPIDHPEVCFSASQILDAMRLLEDSQPLGRVTRAVHAAALWREGEDLLVREDVGRHNALDKLIGAAAPAGGGAGGLLLLTSRVSVEMVQKAAVLGSPVVCAVSAPTALAVRMAEAAGLTLVGVARRDGFEVFSHPRRIALVEPEPSAPTVCGARLADHAAAVKPPPAPASQDNPRTGEAG